MTKKPARRIGLYTFLFVLYLASTVPVGLVLYSIKPAQQATLDRPRDHPASATAQAQMTINPTTMTVATQSDRLNMTPPTLAARTFNKHTRVAEENCALDSRR